MKSRVIWISAGLLLLVVILSMGVVAEKGPASPVFGDSLIQPTHEEVHVGDALGFTIYVVNSGDVTATDVLVWNPIPAGAEFLSVSGGAFPVVGDPITGAISLTPPEGYAYNTRSRMVVPLEEDSDVTGIAWVGDIPSDTMRVLGLTVAVGGPARRDLVDQAFIYDDRELTEAISGTTWVRPYRIFLLFIYNQFRAPTPTPTPGPTITTTTVFTIPDGSGMGIGCGSQDPDYQRALSGDGSEKGCGDTRVDLGQYAPDGPYLPNYQVQRFYAGWDTSSLPDDAEIVSATLTLDVACSPPNPAFNAIVYRGVWTPPLDEADWYATGEQVIGQWDTSDFPCSWELGRWETVLIPLDPTAINPTGTTLVEIRSDQEGTPPVASDYQVVMISSQPHYLRLTVTYREVLP